MFRAPSSVLTNNYKRQSKRTFMGAKTYRDARGYLRFKDSRRLVHRWKAEKSMGRRLQPGEVVHHKNSFKTDNRNGNLRVFSSSAEHRAHHVKRAWEQTRRRRSVRKRSGRRRR